MVGVLLIGDVVVVVVMVCVMNDGRVYGIVW